MRTILLVALIPFALAGAPPQGDQSLVGTVKNSITGEPLKGAMVTLIQVLDFDQALPAGVPQGLDRLSSVWTAPFPDYAPPFLHSSSFGYLLSAAFGSGLILLAALVADRAFAARRRSP